MDEQTFIDDFRAALEAAGLKTHDEIHPYRGKPERFHVEGDSNGSENGWYVLHIDERPAGQFGTMKDQGSTHTWTAKHNRKLSPDERRALEIRIAEQRKVRDAEFARAQDEAAVRADEIWGLASAAPESHDYLQRKGVHPYGIRVSNTSLVIPMRSADGKLWSLQFITIGGDKKYLTGGRKRGCFATIARSAADLSTIAVVEGYATGASVHEAMGWAVAVAFDSGNLEPVAVALKNKYPDARIVVCGDNDRWNPSKGNPGKDAAEKAARAVKGDCLLPEFKTGEGRPTDWNDLHMREGLEGIRLQLEAPKPEPEPAPVELERKNSSGHFPMVIPWALTNKNGKPIPNIENASVLLEYRGVTVRYNVIKKDLEIIIPNETYLVDTQRNDKMTRLLSMAASVGLNRDRFEDFISFLAGQNPYNPVIEWVNSVEWDGRSRLQDFYDSVRGELDDDPEKYALKTTLLKRWLVQAIALAFSPFPISTYGVLVFSGAQHVGKTHWFKRLVPQAMNVAKDGLTLKPDDKDSVLQAVSFWLVELGELDSTFKKSEISSLKAFITNESDIVRPPYARSANAYQRRTAFFGSVNDEEFLADTTGNRRFWTIRVKSLDTGHAIDTQQLWAEVKKLYEQGEPYYLTKEELAALNQSNKDFELTNPVEELIRAKYNWGEAKTYRELTASEIAMEIGIPMPKQTDTRLIAKAMKEITGDGPTRRHDKGKVFKVPHLPTKETGGGLWER